MQNFGLRSIIQRSNLNVFIEQIGFLGTFLNYLIPRTYYVKAFHIAFHILMFYCNSNRIYLSAGIKEQLQFLQVKMLILFKTMIAIFTFKMSFVRCV